MWKNIHIRIFSHLSIWGKVLPFEFNLSPFITLSLFIKPGFIFPLKILYAFVVCNILRSNLLFVDVLNITPVLRFFYVLMSHSFYLKLVVSVNYSSGSKIKILFCEVFFTIAHTLTTTFGGEIIFTAEHSPILGNRNFFIYFIF